MKEDNGGNQVSSMYYELTHCRTKVVERRSAPFFSYFALHTLKHFLEGWSTKCSAILHTVLK